MKSIKNKIFTVVLFLTVAFSPLVAPSAHAGSIGDLLGAVFTGGLSLVVQAVTMDFSFSNILNFGITQFLLGGDLYTSAMLCGAGIICSNEGGAPVAILTSDATNGVCSSAIPVTFYIPSFNQGYITNLCYDDTKTTTTFGWYSDATTTTGGEHCASPSSITSQRYRAPVFGEPGYVCPNNGYMYNGVCYGSYGFDFFYGSSSSSSSATTSSYDCSIQDSNGMYIKTPITTAQSPYGFSYQTGGDCYSLYEKQVPGDINETRSRIALYRFSAPVSQFQNSDGTINNQALATWFLANPQSYYGSGGGFIDKVGGGWGIDEYGSTWGPAVTYFNYSGTNSPIKVLNYSNACKNGVCTIIDNSNVPQNSFVVYAAKMLRGYTEPVTTYCPMDFYGGSSCQDTTTYQTMPGKFLSTTKSTTNGTNAAYNDFLSSLATFPWLYKDTYGLGNVYLGPIRTGATDTCATNPACCSSPLIPPGTTPLTLNVSISGTGTGTITSVPSGINCGSICSALFGTGSSVTITATPETGSTFTNWIGTDSAGSPVCSTNPCTITMNEAKTVQAVFTLGGGTGGSVGCTPDGTYHCTGVNTIASCSDQANCGKTITTKVNFCADYCGTQQASDSACGGCPGGATETCDYSACALHSGTWKEVSP